MKLQIALFVALFAFAYALPVPDEEPAAAAVPVESAKSTEEPVVATTVETEVPEEVVASTEPIVVTPEAPVPAKGEPEESPAVEKREDNAVEDNSTGPKEKRTDVKPQEPAKAGEEPAVVTTVETVVIGESVSSTEPVAVSPAAPAPAKDEKPKEEKETKEKENKSKEEKDGKDKNKSDESDESSEESKEDEGKKKKD